MLLIAILLFLIGSTCSVSTHEVDFFGGRSGDIIVQSDNDVIDNSAILLRGSQFENNQLKTIEDIRVADLFAHVMGTQPINVHANRDGFPKGDLFNKPKATLLVTLDSVAPELFAKYSTWKDSYNVGLTTQSFPANTYTIATNLATGVKPSEHGVVGETWVSPTDIKETAEGASLRANTADILSQEWQDESLIVSASASAPLASVFAVKEQLVRRNTFSLSLKDGAFQSTYAQTAHPLALNQQELQALLKESSFSTFLGGVTFNNNKITATADSRTVTFDLSVEADFSFLAELGFVHNLLNNLEFDPHLSNLVVDNVPDFFAIAFSSLKDIKGKYGENSDVFIVSLSLVGSVAQKIEAQLDKLYNNRVVSGIICLNTRTVVSTDVKQAVFNIARRSLRREADFEAYYPSLYVHGDTTELCNKLKNAVESTTVKIHCSPSIFYEYEFSINGNVGNSTDQEPLNVPAFWILLWMAVIVTLFILGGVYALVSAGIEASTDSLLFRSTGRHHHQN